MREICDESASFNVSFIFLYIIYKGFVSFGVRGIRACVCPD